MNKKDEAVTPSFQCAGCEDYFLGHGHNGEPLYGGRVCNHCNVLVLQARLRNFVDRQRVLYTLSPPCDECGAPGRTLDNTTLCFDCLNSAMGRAAADVVEKDGE